MEDSHKIFNEPVLEQLRDLKRGSDDNFDRLNKRIDRLEIKLDKVDEKIGKFDDRVNSAARHGQIATGTTISIALAVIYSLLK